MFSNVAAPSLGQSGSSTPGHGNEFSGPNLTEFLRSFDDPTLLFEPGDMQLASMLNLPDFDEPTPAVETENKSPDPVQLSASAAAVVDPTQPANKSERYLLTAADQKDGPRDERLARVIHAKFEAGLIKPYDCASGEDRR